MGFFYFKMSKILSTHSYNIIYILHSIRMQTLSIALLLNSACSVIIITTIAMSMNYNKNNSNIEEGFTIDWNSEGGGGNRILDSKDWFTS